MSYNEIKKEVEKENKIKNDVVSFSDFIKEDLPSPRWVAEGLIPEGMTILSSTPGQFKTYILLEMARQISNGELCLNHFTSTKRNILFVNEEMGKRMMQDRLKTLEGEFGNIYFTNLSGVKLEDFSTILNICKEKEITLVIFDSLTRIHNLSENDASDVKKIFESVLLLLKSNISVVMTHHHRKSPIIGSTRGSDEMRGSTDLLAQIDCHIAIEEVSLAKDYMILNQLKLRQAENINSFRVDINRDREKNTFGFVYKGAFSKEDARDLKVEQNRDIVFAIVKDNPGLTKIEIIERLKGKVGQVPIEYSLSDMEKTGTIYCRTKKPKTYFLRLENTLI
jgi:hypothetical protein